MMVVMVIDLGSSILVEVDLRIFSRYCTSVTRNEVHQILSPGRLSDA